MQISSRHIVPAALLIALAAIAAPAVHAVGDPAFPSVKSMLVVNEVKAPKFEGGPVKIGLKDAQPNQQTARHHPPVHCHTSLQYTTKAYGFIVIRAWSKMTGVLAVDCAGVKARYSFYAEGPSVGFQSVDPDSTNPFQQVKKGVTDGVHLRLVNPSDAEKLAGKYMRTGAVVFDGEVQLSPFFNSRGTLQMELAMPKGFDTLLALEFKTMILKKL